MRMNFKIIPHSLPKIIEVRPCSFGQVRAKFGQFWDTPTQCVRANKKQT